MEDYQSNSYKSKEDKSKSSLSSEPKKKVESVIPPGSAQIRKKSGIRKFVDVFVPEDVDSVKDYIFTDVLIPAIKKAVSDVITNGTYMFLYGETKKSSSTNYNTVSKISYKQDENSSKKNYISNPYKVYDFDSVKLETAQQAEMVLDSMNDIIAQYQIVSVADLYDIAGISIDNYAAYNYGWKDIRGCSIVREKDCYILKLPKPIPIN